MRPPSIVANINALLGWNRHPRNGKVARLPEATRLWINQMLDEGLRYRDIIQKLTEAGILGISEMNLSNWYKGGYQDYLKKKLAAEAGLPPDFDPGASLREQVELLTRRRAKSH